MPLLLASATLVVAALAPAGASAATGAIAGTAFKDMNRNGAVDADEPRLADQQLYLFNAGGQYVAGVYSDAGGQYRFTGLADGSYRVEYASSSWWPLRDEWVPTTTGSLLPKVSVNLTGAATADFGWRPIVRSTNVSLPLSSYVGSNGLRVNSYDDVVGAREIYDAVLRGTVGAEAQHVTIRFDFSPNSSTSAAWQGSPGSYSDYNAVCYDNYISWLTAGDIGVSHEYGHAWSLYYDTIVQQQGTLAAYLKARGLEGDSRVNNSYAWSPREMIAEDYRQLLGSPTARAGNQMNQEIPPAAQVAGLTNFLQTTFTTSAAPPPPPPPPPAPALAIANLAVSPSPVVKSGTVAFSLSAAASVTVKITTAAGGAIRTLLFGAAKPAGSSSVVWDRKNSAGQRVKAGTYKAVVTAVDPSGQTVTQTVSFTVS